MKDVLITFAVVLFWVFVLAGTAYLVEWRGWSAWWFVLALMLVSAVSTKGDTP